MYGRIAGEGPWKLIADALLSNDLSSNGKGQGDGAAIDLRAMTSGMRLAADFYGALPSRGLQYAPGLRPIAELWQGPRSAIARLAIPRPDSSWPIHPALMDGCLHMVAATRDEADDATYMPIGWERFAFDEIPPGEIVCHAVLGGGGEDAGGSSGAIVADLVLYDEAGARIGELTGLTLRRTTRSGLPSQSKDLDGLFYDVGWKKRALTPGASSTSEGAWLVVASTHSQAMPLASELASHDRTVALALDAGRPEQESGDDARDVGAADGVAAGGSDVGPVIAIDQRSREAWRSLLEDLSGQGPLSGVVFLATPSTSSTLPTPAALPDSALELSERVLAISQALATAEGALSGGLTLVTTGGQGIAGERIECIEASCVWGFGRSLEIEEPTLKVRLIDLDPEPVTHPPDDPATGDPATDGLIAELLTPDAETQVCWRAGARYVARLLPGKDLQQLDLPGDVPWRLSAGDEGALGNLAVVEAEQRSLQEGEVRIEVEAAGLDSCDVPAATRLVDLESPLGVEVCGRVVETGPGVDHLAAGDRVAGFASPAFAREVATRADRVAKAPERLSAAALVSCLIQSLDDPAQAEPQRLVSALRDVMSRVESGELAPPPHGAWSMCEAPRVMDFMRDGLHAGQVALTAPPVAGDGLCGDRSYLVTGGMGGLGLKVARYMAEQGAGTVILCGRGVTDVSATAEVESLRALGAEIVVELVDVSDADKVRALFARIREQHEPLAGIVHCAGEAAGASLDNQTAEILQRVFAPKVAGGWHLHQESLELDLDFFVLFSSMAGVTGNPGQASYAAANAWLDRLANHRRAIGLCAQSIAWGAWAEVGMAVEALREGVTLPSDPFPPEQGIEAFDRLLRNGPATSGVADIDWRPLRTRIAGSPYFQEVLAVAGEPSGTGASVVGGIAARLASARPADRPQLVEALLKEEVAAVLQLPEPPPSDVGFFDLGMDSLTAVELSNRLNGALAGAGSVGRTVAFDHPDIRSLTVHLVESLDLGELAAPPSASRSRVALADDPVAIVGMACRFPKAENVASFRRLLERGAHGISRIPTARLGKYRVVDALPPEARFGGFVDGIDRFDAPFFRIAPVEANVMDPQQRMLLETTWEALEDAGIDPRNLRGEPVGVYAGIGEVDYRHLVPYVTNHFAAAGTTASVAVGRIAFTLGLEGPAMSVDTACSSSLVAMHQAVVALQRGEADMTLAGGVNLVLLPEVTVGFVGMDVVSPDGRCKTFDAAADGFARGEGCGMLVLKRLADAEADGDRIWAVIKGSAVNHDGISAGLSVPSGTAQERVIRQALARARVEPADVDYLEAHGTGTPVGDPIEVRSAAAVYGEGRDPDRPLMLGSVKTNVGHLETASGVAGAIKAILALRSPVLFRHLHFKEPNPHIEWDELPVKVTTEAAPWPDANGRPRRVGVSSFGYSGTNAHVILESHGEPDRADPRGVKVQPQVRVRADAHAEGQTGEEQPARTQRLLTLSGQSERAVSDLAERYLAWLGDAERDLAERDAADHRRDLLADMAFTAAVGRSHLDHRAAVVFPGADDKAGADELASELRRIAAGEGIAKTHRDPKVAFLFSPVGGQWPGMGRDLYETEPVAREVMDRCAAVMDDLRAAPEPPATSPLPPAAIPLLDVMFGAAGDLVDPAWNQPVLYALNSALVRLWARAGVRPQAAIGHSFGEIVAAHAAGAYSLEDGMRLAALRGALIGTTDKAGSMAAVFAPPDALAGALERFPAVHLAADNGTHQVVSGLADEVARLTDHFRRADVRVEPLSTGAAGHSSLMDPILHELEEAAATLSASPPAIDLVSNVTGAVWPRNARPDGAYWRRHAREPVAFAAGLKALAATGANVLIEIGPSPALAGMASVIWPNEDAPAVISSLAGEGEAGFAHAVGEAYKAGVALDFHSLFDDQPRRRISIPSYPFQRERYWIEGDGSRSVAPGHAVLGTKSELGSGMVVYEQELDGARFSWIADHRVFDQALVPGAMYGALAAAVQTEFGVAARVDDLRIHAPWLIPDAALLDDPGAHPAAELQVVLSEPEAGKRCEMYGRIVGEGPWKLMAEARLSSRDVPKPMPSADLRALAAGMRLVEVADFYDALERRGIGYGPAFRPILELWRGSGSAMARLALLPELQAPEGSSAESPPDSQWPIHPALLDGCLQTVAAIREDVGDATYMPIGWESFALDDAPTGEIVCHAALGAGGAEGGGSRDTMVADLVFYDEAGGRVGEIAGLTIRRATRSDLLSQSRDVDGLFYDVGWKKRALISDASSTDADEGTWLVVASTHSEAMPLATALASHDRTVALAVDSARPEQASAVEVGQVIAIDQRSREAWRSLLEELSEQVPLSGVVFLATSPTTAFPPDAALELSERLLALSQALATAEGALSGGLTLVTTDGQSIAGERIERIEASCAWGFGRSLTIEEPALKVRLIDLDAEPAASPADGHDLITELLAPDDETQVCWRAGTRYVARLLPGKDLQQLDLPGDVPWHLSAGEDGVLGNLAVVETEQSPLQEGEVRIEVEAAGLNFHDVLVAMRLIEVGAPLGGEVCGRVVATGPGVEGLATGDRVAGFAAPAFASEVTTSAALVVKAPERRSAAALAGMPAVFCTAWDCLDIAGIAAGERVLIHAAAGGIGHAAIQIARNAGAEIWATASAGKREHVLSLGATRVFDSRSTDFGVRILEATDGEGLDVVLNSLTGEGFIEASLSCLREGGRFVEISKRGKWSAEKMARVRPDVAYSTYALDEQVQADPDRFARLLREVMGRVESGELAPPPHGAWSMSEAPRVMDFMRDGRHVGKLVLTVPRVAGDGLRADRSYLVTGGMGGLGLEVARYMAERGAGTIVLCGRSAPDEHAAAAIESLGAVGAKVVVERADVSDAEQVRALITRIRDEHEPLAGIIHSAGVLADASLDNQTREMFERVFAPKIRGAWHLHQESLELDLDLFVLFSSMAGMTGNPGQTNHAAANAWLDQLARYRRAIGLSAQSIAWGLWAEVGAAAVIAREPGSTPGDFMTPGQGIEAFDRALRRGTANSVVAPVDWGSLSAGIADAPFFANVLPTSAGSRKKRAARATGEIAARLASARPAERPALLEVLVKEEIAAVLQLPKPPPSEVGFFDLGMDSLTAVELSSRLNRALEGAGSVGRTVAFDHPDVGSLTAHLARELNLSELKAATPKLAPRTRVVLGDDPIAITGMACRFPKAPNIQSFRRLLERGGSGVDRIPNARLGEFRVPDALPPEARFGGFVDGIDRFDALFFRISPLEAKWMDPQQRMLLETTWEALEDAGIDPRSLRGEPVGVFAGMTEVDYRQLVTDASTHFAASGTSSNVAIGRIAFTLGLEGPAMAVDTACSSSLVAIHQAVVALQRGEADMTLAGGVNLALLPSVTVGIAGTNALAPDGRCKTFDAAADGFVRGEGCGMLVLKRLADAEADGDRIWALIKGSAVNHDGASAGLSVPSGPAQQRVIRRALERARVEPADVDYLEAHGTGTPLGDPIEVRSAGAVYGEGRDPDRPLLLGSVKTNLGHLEAAAGVTGLIKAVLTVRNSVPFRHLNFETPNPHIEWDELPVKVTTEPAPWPDSNGRPRRAGVSSFGYSGTNAHVILESDGEPDRAGPRGARLRPEVRVGGSGDTPAEGRPARTQRMLPLSGQSPRAVSELAGRYLAWLDDAGERSRDLLADMAFTAAVGRSHFDHRAAVVFSGADGKAGAGIQAGPEDLVSGLRRIAAGEGIAKTCKDPKVAFMFSPVGGQWPGMGRDLYESEPAAREVMDRCTAVMDDLRAATEPPATAPLPPAAIPLLDVMFGAAGDLVDPAWNQPVLYALNSALVRLWAGVGVRPQAAIGHSFGEIVAAHAAGAYSLEDGMRLAALRGALIGTTDKAGSMAAVFAPPDMLAEALERFPAVHLAADNGMHQVVSGLADEVARLTDQLRRTDVRVEPLSTGAAGHSSLMDPILHELEEAASTLSASPPRIDLVSNVTGQPWPQGGGPDGAYWRRHAREPVAFAAGLKALAATGANVLIEIGPSPALAGMASAIWPAEDPPPVIASLAGEGEAGFAHAVGEAYKAGLALDFHSLFGDQPRRRISIPSYPFQRERYWIEGGGRKSVAPGHPLLGTRVDLASGETVFEARINRNGFGWLDDHRIFGRVVVPATTFGAMIAAAIRKVAGLDGVSTVQLHSALVMEGGLAEGAERALQVVVGPPDADGKRALKVHSRAPGGAQWLLHADGTAWPQKEPESKRAHQGSHLLDDLQARLPETSPSSLYETLETTGIELGPAFRRVQSLWNRLGEAVAVVGLSDERSLPPHAIRPVLLDACLHALAAHVPAGAADRYMPFSWQKLWIAESLGSRVACHAALREGDQSLDPDAPPDTLVADVRIYDDEGSVIGEILGLSLRKSSASALMASAALAATTDHHGRPESPLPPDRSRPGPATRRRGHLTRRLQDVSAIRKQQLALEFVRDEITSILELSEPPPADTGFFDLGIDSIIAIELRRRLDWALGSEAAVSNTIVFEHPTPGKLAEHLALQVAEPDDAAERPPPATTSRSTRREGAGRDAPDDFATRDPGARPFGSDAPDGAVAIVGMACKFPGADDLDEFWSLLEQGRSAVGEVPPDRWDPDALDVGTDYVRNAARWGAFVDDVDRFDARLFRIASVDARLLDPQSRMLIQTSWHALEDAGIDPKSLRGNRVGVFSGIVTSDYRELLYRAGGAFTAFHVGMSGDGSSAVGRVSYTLGLEGPAVPVNAACSSSLVALHQAVAALERDEADLALAGGVNAILTPTIHQMLSEMRLMSESGVCCPFDTSSDGFVRGEGCGMLVLKRLSDALSSGDRIWAVVRGSAVNHNGAGAGFVAPNLAAQKRVIADAVARANATPAEVDYLEAHGSSTPMGDEAELRAAGAVYGSGRPADRPLLMGSVKTNVGHLEAAAGTAAVIKSVLAMNAGRIPAHLNLQSPIGALRESRGVRVVAADEAWPATNGRPRLTGVNSFGMTGSNAHVILEGPRGPVRSMDEPWRPSVVVSPRPVLVSPPSVAVGPSPDENGSATPRTVRLLALSANDHPAVNRLAARYSAWLRNDPSAAAEAHERLADMAFTAAIGRSHFDCRAALPFADADSLRQALASVADRRLEVRSDSGASAALLFPDVGEGWPLLDREFVTSEPVVQAVLDRCGAVAHDELGVDLTETLLAGAPAAQPEDAGALIHLLYHAAACAHAELWKSLSLQPVAAFGEGAGEIAAACALGALSLEEGCRLAVAFGRNRRGDANGSAIADFSARTAAGLLVSALAGGKAESRLADAALSLSRSGATMFLLLQPHTTLARRLVASWPDSDGELPVPHFIQPDMADNPQRVDTTASGSWIDTVAQAYESGLDLDLEGLHVGERRRRISIPHYPFEPRRHWVDS